MKEDFRLTFHKPDTGSTSSIKIAVAWYSDGKTEVLGLIGREIDLITEGIITARLMSGGWSFVFIATDLDPDDDVVYQRPIDAQTRQELIFKVMDIARDRAAEREKAAAHAARKRADE